MESFFISVDFDSFHTTFEFSLEGLIIKKEVNFFLRNSIYEIAKQPCRVLPFFEVLTFIQLRSSTFVTAMTKPTSSGPAACGGGVRRRRHGMTSPHRMRHTLLR